VNGHTSVLQCEQSVISLYENLEIKEIFKNNDYKFIPGEKQVWEEFLGWEIKSPEMFEFLEFLANFAYLEKVSNCAGVCVEFPMHIFSLN
jgi:hypothetical protein